MEPLKLVGVLMMVIAAVEVPLFRFLASRSENLRKVLPLLMVAAAVPAVVGLGLFIFG
ncbi:MAG: hypothetical protein SFU83_14135 [Meiothermus sp.]|nr:hypothetical protein [Meiothermus sp.]